jgi:protein-tyrosine-phosphatase
MIETDNGACPDAIYGRIAHDLGDEYRGTFSEQTIMRLVMTTAAEYSRTATTPRWLPLCTERTVRTQLRVLARHSQPTLDHEPAVLFVSTHDAGQSQIAAAWLRYLTDGHAVAWSCGPNPTPELAAAITAVLAEIGIDGTAVPTPAQAEELTLAADAVVTVGEGDACTVLPGKHYEDWALADPASDTLEELRRMRDLIGSHVAHLAHEVGITAA